LLVPELLGLLRLEIVESAGTSRGAARTPTAVVNATIAAVKRTILNRLDKFCVVGQKIKKEVYLLDIETILLLLT
jgi:hypothetical protein